jgi:hypothetical protein
MTKKSLQKEVAKFEKSEYDFRQIIVDRVTDLLIAFKSGKNIKKSLLIFGCTIEESKRIIEKLK